MIAEIAINPAESCKKFVANGAGIGNDTGSNIAAQIISATCASFNMFLIFFFLFITLHLSLYHLDCLFLLHLSP